MTLHWPQIVWISLAALHLLCVAILDGRERTGKHSLSITTLGIAFSAWLFWCGGFFG
jgi:hypothetical protein